VAPDRNTYRQHFKQRERNLKKSMTKSCSSKKKFLFRSIFNFIPHSFLLFQSLPLLPVFILRQFFHPLVLQCYAPLHFESPQDCIRQSNKKYFFMKLTYVTERDQVLFPSDFSFKSMCLHRASTKARWT
jgi:hypothetical protein